MTKLTQRALERSLKGAIAAADPAEATRGLLARAEREGLIDVAYATVASPFGRLLVAQTDRGVVSLGLPNLPDDEFLTALSEGVSPRVLESPAQLDAARRQLDAYFEGRRHAFDLPVDWRLSHGFRGRVLHNVALIPYGDTITYATLARKAGNPRAFRAAGTACGHNPIPLIVPCHRVVRSDGEPGSYGGGPEMKRALLQLEGALG